MGRALSVAMWIALAASACGSGEVVTDGSTPRDYGPTHACAAAAECASGFCVDGVCCSSACGGGASDCQACTHAMTGVADGVCAPVASGTTCRPSAGPCDFAEVCDGASAGCPGDVKVPARIPCRSAAGACDAEETCDGAAAACPPDAMRAAGSVCRPSRGECDLEDVCDGASAECADAFQPATTTCGTTPRDVCDAPDTCSGTSADCVERYAAGVVCRPAAGGCDVEEVCLGTVPFCPPDGVLAPGVVCRASTNLSCDPTEVCDGLEANCPADVHCFIIFP